MAWSKFRAKERSLDEQVIYGVGVVGTHLAYDFLIMEKLKYTSVIPQSIAQHVAFDKDGKEVYDDDILVDENSNEFSAVLALHNNNTGELIPIENPFRILDYRLKGRDKNADV